MHFVEIVEQIRAEFARTLPSKAVKLSPTNSNTHLYPLTWHACHFKLVPFAIFVQICILVYLILLHIDSSH